MNSLSNCLKLADGTILEGDTCGYSEPSLWCWIGRRSMAECFDLFNNPQKTREITVYFTASGIVYRGFTDLRTVKKGSDTIDVQLTWPEGGEHSIEEFVIPKEKEG